MTMRRLMFVHDHSTMACVDRYIALDNGRNFAAFYGSPEELRARAADPTQGGRFLLAPETVAAIRRDANSALAMYDQWMGIRARVAATDYFAPSRWAVTDADRAEDSPSPSLREFLATRSPTAQTTAFIHYADTERARGYLTQALTITPERVAAMPSAAAQNAAVIDAWRALAGYFQALGLRPWSLAELRSTWEVQLGQWYNEMTSCPMIGREINNHSTGTADPPGNYNRLLFARRPTPLDMTDYGGQGAAGAWRNEAFRRLQGQFAAGDLTARKRVRFGSRQDVDRTTPGGAACIGIGAERGPTTCTGPNGDVHRIWLTNAATLGGGVNYTDAATVASLFDRLDCVPRSLVNGRTDGPPPIISGPPGFNWLCGAVGKPIGDAEAALRGLTFLGARARYNYFLPPLLWYLQLIQPVLRYLASRDPAEVILEASLDVVGKNTWTAISCGADVSQVIAEGYVAGQIQSGGIRAGVQRLIGVATIGGGVVGILAPGVGSAAIVGISRLLSAAVNAASIDENYRLDVFGRVEPALDSLSLIPYSRAVDAPYAEALMPPPSPWEAGYAGNATVIRDGTPPPALALRIPLSSAEPAVAAQPVPGLAQGVAVGGLAPSRLGLGPMLTAIDPSLVRSPPPAAAPLVIMANPWAQPVPEEFRATTHTLSNEPPAESSGSSAWKWGLGLTMVAAAGATAWHFRDDIGAALRGK